MNKIRNRKQISLNELFIKKLKCLQSNLTYVQTNSE